MTNKSNNSTHSLEREKHNFRARNKRRILVKELQTLGRFGRETNH